MLLSNYGRDQVGESFDGSQQSPSVEVPSPSAVVDRSLNLKTPPADQMLAAAACQRPQQQQEQRRLKPHSDQVLKCPRCDSMNTKFCYYNNYSLTQPRHFCKNCKRYWTKGGALRNVPVGGGCRKNKRVKQRHQDQGHPPPSGTSDELPTGAASGSPDGASSSSILQQEFPAPYEVPKSLPFEPRIFPGTTTPISINWAGQLSSQAYDPSILGLNLPTTGIKQEPVHGADINSIFDPGLSSYMSMNIPVENFGINTAPPTAPEVLWRFPQQPKLVSLLEDGNEQEARGLLELGEKIKQHKGKTSGESMQVSGEYDQQGDSSSSPEWQHTPDGFFEAAPETGYWSGNGAWSSELHSYSATPGTGNHQML